MSPVERVRAAAEARGLDPKRNGRGYRMLCPAHEDRRPSLDVDQADDGRALLKCRAGCNTENVVAALGLTMRDLFDPHAAYVPPRHTPKRPPDPLPSEDAIRTWAQRLTDNQPLLDRLGELRGWTREALTGLQIGFDGHRLTIPVRGPEGELLNLPRYLPNAADPSEKMRSLKGRPRELFPAPESLPDGKVWVVEGEPDAISMASLGIPAVAVPGAQTWRREWAPRFAGRRVVVCCDCDKAGRALAQQVIGSLSEHAAEVRCVDLAPGRDDGHDVGELTADARTSQDRDELAQMLRSIAENAQSESPPVTDEPRQPRGKLRRLDVAQMLSTQPPPVPWLVDDLLVRGALTLLAGREGEGKSLTALRAAVGIVNGANLAGLRCRQGRVLIIDAENGAGEIHRRIHTSGLQQQSHSQLVICDAQGWHLGRDAAELRALIAEHRPSLVVLDSFRSLWPGGEENESGPVAAVLDPLRNLLRDHDAAGLLLHHAAKQGTGYRGSSAIGAACELAFIFESVPEDPDPQRRRITCTKCRPAAKPATKWWHISGAGGRLDLKPAEPFDGAAASRAPARAEARVRLLSALHTQIEGFPSQAAWLRAAGFGPKDKTPRDARDELLDEGLVVPHGSGFRLAEPEGPEGVSGVAPLKGTTPHTPQAIRGVDSTPRDTPATGNAR